MSGSTCRLARPSEIPSGRPSRSRTSTRASSIMEVSLTADGLEMFLQVGAAGHATRPDDGRPVRSNGPSSTAAVIDPFVVPDSNAPTTPSTTRGAKEGHRSSSAPREPCSVFPAPVPGIAAAIAASDDLPVVTADELSLFFRSYRPWHRTGRHLALHTKLANGDVLHACEPCRAQLRDPTTVQAWRLPAAASSTSCVATRRRPRRSIARADRSSSRRKEHIVPRMRIGCASDVLRERFANRRRADGPRRFLPRTMSRGKRVRPRCSLLSR